MTYVMTLVVGEEFRERNEGLEAASISGDGVVVDVSASLRESLRVIGVASSQSSPEQWRDDETPAVRDHDLIFSLHSSDFWLGLFAPVPM